MAAQAYVNETSLNRKHLLLFLRVICVAFSSEVQGHYKLLKLQPSTSLPVDWLLPQTTWEVLYSYSSIHLQAAAYSMK